MTVQEHQRTDRQLDRCASTICGARLVVQHAAMYTTRQSLKQAAQAVTEAGMQFGTNAHRSGVVLCTTCNASNPGRNTDDTSH